MKLVQNCKFTNIAFVVVFAVNLHNEGYHSYIRNTFATIDLNEQC